MLRILEIAWLIFAITGALFSVYKLVTDGYSEALFPVFFTLVASVFYLIRRKQRIALEKENEGIHDTSLKP